MPDLPDWTGLLQIAGSDITIPVNISASAVTLDVSIAASTVTLNENITGQTVAVYSGSQYQPVNGNGIYIHGSATGQTWSSSLFGLNIASYTVPTGKTFYAQAMGIAISQVQASNVYVFLYNGTNYVAVGQSMIFDTPIPFASGVNVTLGGYGYWTGSASLNVVAIGWVQ